jgi:sialate O-acetylesterase
MWKCIALASVSVASVACSGNAPPSGPGPSDPATPADPPEQSSGPAPAGEPVSVSGLFSDHMVLQRGIEVPIWGTSGAGQGISVTLSDASGVKASAATKADAQGKWKALLPKLTEGGPYTLSIKGQSALTFADVMVGEVWIASGQSNMAHAVSAQSPASVVEADKAAAEGLNDVRFLSVSRFPNDAVPPGIGGRWEACDQTSAAAFSAVGYHFARELNQALHVPVGVINASWSGTLISAWMGPESLAALAEAEGEASSSIEQRWALTMQEGNNQALADAYLPKFIDWRTSTALPAIARGDAFGPPPAAPFCKFHPWYPSALFLGMISPLAPYGTKGFIWWQGEGNADWPNEYALAFPLLIEEWRHLWGQGDLPFLFVQLGGNSYQRAALRQAQLSSLSTPDTGMAVSVDVPTIDGTHAAQYESVGRRLSLWARAKAYGEDNLAYSGPLYESMTIAGSAVRLTFDHAESGLKLKSVGPAHKGFQVASASGTYVDATSVTIDSSKGSPAVVVKSASVPSPVNVRYLWGGSNSTPYSSASLYSNEDLPASPFNPHPPPSAPVEEAAPLPYGP